VPAAAIPAPAGPPAGRLVDPVAAAAVAAAAIRADEEAAARAAAGWSRAVASPAVAPGGSAPAGSAVAVAPAPPAPRPATARFAAPAVESGAGAPPAPPEESGGLAGLFGDAPDPSPWTPAATPAAEPAAVPPVVPAAEVAPLPVPLVGPRRRSPAARRRLALLAAAAVLAVVVLVGLVVGLAGGEGGAAAQEGPAAGTAPATPTPAGPTPGTRTVVDGRTFLLQRVQVADTCVGNAYGDVASAFEASDCAGLARALWSTDVDGRAVVVSVSAVDTGDPAAARSLRTLADTDGSGNVSDLLREGVDYPGSPAELSGAEYASAVAGSVVTIVETAWSDGRGGDAADLDVVAGTGLTLPMPAPTAG
jgi:hypothetical protein